MATLGNLLNPNQRLLDQNQTNPLSILAESLFSRATQRQAEMQQQKELERQIQMFKLMNTASQDASKNIKTDMGKATNLVDNPNQYGATYLKPKMKLENGKVSISAETVDPNEDLDKFQMEAAKLGIDPTGKSKGTLIQSVAQRNQEKISKEQTPAQEAADKEAFINASKVTRLDTLVDMIEKKYAETKTPGGASGIIRRPIEAMGRHIQSTENQRIDKSYADFTGGIKAQLARAMGDVGNLSEYEQKTVMKMIPSLWDDPETAKLKVQNLREFVKQVQSTAGKKVGGQAVNVETGISSEQALAELKRRGLIQ